MYVSAGTLRYVSDASDAVVVIDAVTTFLMCDSDLVGIPVWSFRLRGFLSRLIAELRGYIDQYVY